MERYKARLVTQGFSQKYGLDYDETFSPVVRTESVRTLIALAAQKSLKLHQMDVTGLPQRPPRRGGVHDATRRLCSQREGEFGVSIEQKHLWSEVVSEMLDRSTT